MIKKQTKKEGEEMENLLIMTRGGGFYNGEGVEELAIKIINKFSDAGLSCGEAKVVLERVKDVLEERSLARKVT